MPFFAKAVESLDVSGYGLIISSCGPAVMGVNPRQDAVHVSYIHSPQRAWWDLYAARQAQMIWPVKQLFVHSAMQMRIFEFNAMQRVDQVVTNSQYIARRVAKYFRRNSTVIYPPVNAACGYLSNKHDDYYLSVSRLDSEKRIDLLIGACNRLGRRLVIAGSGRMEKHLKDIAGPTIEFLGRVPNKDLPGLYARCRAFLFAADEDFGIVPVEAQSYGRPVLAYGHGGSLETVRVNSPNLPSDTGLYFDTQSVESVVEGLKRFESAEGSFDPCAIRKHALRFDVSVFKKQFRSLVEHAIKQSCEEQCFEIA